MFCNKANRQVLLIGPVYWSQDYLIWGPDPPQGLPSKGAVLQRIHPEDRERVDA